jgi:hypothetical protein
LPEEGQGETNERESRLTRLSRGAAGRGQNEKQKPASHLDESEGRVLLRSNLKRYHAQAAPIEVSSDLSLTKFQSVETITE